MRKNCLMLIATCGALLIIGCAKPIMSPVEYHKPIDLHVESNATLYWEIGQQNSSGLVTGNNDSLVSSIVESIDRQNNPSKYMLNYGKAEQSIFMTSFRNILERQYVFKNVVLMTDPKTADPKDVLITIHFRSTRVSSPERGYQISLSVDMSVQGGGKPTFTRTYFVKSNENSFGSFQEQQGNVSNKLAENLITGLKQWHQGK